MSGNWAETAVPGEVSHGRNRGVVDRAAGVTARRPPLVGQPEEGSSAPFLRCRCRAPDELVGRRRQLEPHSPIPRAHDHPLPHRPTLARIERCADSTGHQVGHPFPRELEDEPVRFRHGEYPTTDHECVRAEPPASRTHRHPIQSRHLDAELVEATGAIARFGHLRVRHLRVPRRRTGCPLGLRQTSRGWPGNGPTRHDTARSTRGREPTRGDRIPTASNRPRHHSVRT